MDATRRLEVELPEALARSVSARVESGEFADASEVVATGLALLADRDRDSEDPELDSWLRREAVPAYEEWKASGEEGLTGDEVQASLARRRLSRRDHDAAE